MFKDELGGKIIKNFCGPRAKTYAYLIDCYDDDYDKNKSINKKAKGTKKSVHWNLKIIMIQYLKIKPY